MAHLQVAGVYLVRAVCVALIALRSLITLLLQVRRTSVFCALRCVWWASPPPCLL
jgi:hypothetical protein